MSASRTPSFESDRKLAASGVAAKDFLAGRDGIESLGRDTGLHCPVCGDQKLEVGVLHGTQLCCCPQCLGFLIDSHSLGPLIQEMRAEYSGPDVMPGLMDAKALAAGMECPLCHTGMDTHPYYGPGNAVINSCRECLLIWLDAGEITSVIRAPGKR